MPSDRVICLRKAGGPAAVTLWGSASLTNLVSEHHVVRCRVVQICSKVSNQRFDEASKPTCRPTRSWGFRPAW